jgi:hypothetical protein
MTHLAVDHPYAMDPTPHVDLTEPAPSAGMRW